MREELESKNRRDDIKTGDECGQVTKTWEASKRVQ